MLLWVGETASFVSTTETTLLLLSLHLFVTPFSPMPAGGSPAAAPGCLLGKGLVVKQVVTPRTPSVWGQGQAAACFTRPDAALLQNGHPALVPGWLWVFPKPPKTSQLPALSSARPACNPAAKQQGYISGKAWKSSKTAKFQGDLWVFITKPQVKASANDSSRELMGQMIGSCWCLRGPESCCNGNGEDFPCNEGISLLLTCSWIESNQ